MLTQSRFCSLPTELVNPNCAFGFGFLCLQIKSATGRIDLLAPAPFGLSAQPIYVARIPAAPFAVANIAASAALN